MRPHGFHAQTLTPEARQTIRRTRPHILKVLQGAADRDELENWRFYVPDGKLIYRHWFPNESLEDVPGRCHELLAGLAPIVHLVDFVEIPWNEAHQAGDDLTDYCRASIDATNILHGYGRRVLVGNFSAAQPALDDWPRYYDALRVADGISLHEYSAPAMWDEAGERCLRYRRVLASLPADCRKPVYITETGKDWGMVDGVQEGWRARGGTAPSAYAEQLRWNARELARDGVYATIFQCGSYEDWQKRGFDVAGVPEIEDVVMEEVDVPTVGEGFQKVEGLVGPWREDELWHGAGSEHETSLAIGERGYAIWRKRTNRTVAVLDDGRIMADDGNAGAVLRERR